MNKHLHRIVFNKARGLLMAVAEIASSQTHAAAAGQSGHRRPVATGSEYHATVRATTFVLWATWGLLGFMPPSTASAQIVADRGAPANQRPTVLGAANGTPVVNIQTPSAAGVSRNTYSRFDVERQGAILNNSRTNVQTQLAGWVQGNPWLAGGTARVILNEVNSSNPSLLRGYVEVGGDRAQVVIANPAGVTCDGCGFINANRATLTTGTPILNGGSLDGYRVRGGTVTISGAGLDASSANYTDIIARAVQVNAGIWAQRLNVVAGVNDVSADASLVNKVPTTVADTPAFGIDVSELGGMYAGKITLIGTEAGVGVRNAGDIGATAGSVVVKADGRLENSGTLYAQQGITLNAHGELLNTGTIASQADVSLTADGAELGNSGLLAANGNLGIVAVGLNNVGGQIQAQGAMGIQLGAGTLDNSGSQIMAGGALNISADTVKNESTRDVGLGIEGKSVALDTHTLDNVNGSLRADDALTISSHGHIDNTLGMIASGGTLRVRDTETSAKALTVDNGAGNLYAGQQLSVDSSALGGNGTLDSQGGIDLKLLQDFSHTGQLTAAGSVDLETAGALTNAGSMRAGGDISLKATTLENQNGGEISADKVSLAAADTFSNRGLIDGSGTHIEALTANNFGAGRIYGDHIAIAAATLNNLAENGVAPVIAARTRLDIGAQHIVNAEHALIFSAGDMAIGAALDPDTAYAVGKAATLQNRSATIESLGSLDLSVRQLSNTNEHFSTAIGNTGSDHVVEYLGSGAGKRYASGTPGVYTYDDESLHLHTPDGNYEEWSLYDYSRSVSQTYVASSDPGEIMSGATMNIDADTALNDKSHIIAGGAIVGSIGTLTNTEVNGKKITTDSGTVTDYWRSHDKGKDSTGSSVSGYNPAAKIETISLTPTVYKQDTAPTGTGTKIGDRTVITQVTPPSGTGTVMSGGVDLKIPNNSLFAIAPTGSYLIETDPKFASYRSWLSSDYMLSSLSLDPSATQKRLGDGFYEQKLIREQVAQLTGRRFLDGYASDEAEYQALMDNGALFAKEHQLVPGVALTAAQMAALTSDIVWLVEQEVKLPDGKTAKALVPQLYVRVQDGDLKASGALIAANSLQLDVTGDLNNSGSIAGRNVLALTAQNINNLGGRMSAKALNVSAQNDLNNIGGTLSAEDSLAAVAGHDLNVASTTSTQTSAQGNTTNIGRVAGLYVTGSGGTLVASAGNDLRLAAAVVMNASASDPADATGAGTTTLLAGHDINLDTVAESASHHIVWDGDNRRSDSSRTEVGTVIQAQGSLTLQAGNDLHARAANLTSSDDALVATAGRDIVLATAENQTTVDEAHQHTSKGFLSSKTITTRDTLDQTLNQGSTLSGQRVTLVAGNDLKLQGSNAVSTTATEMIAGGDLTLTVATDTVKESHFRDEKKSGLMGSGGFGFTIGKRQLSTDTDNIRTTASASTVGSVEGDIALQAGKNYRQVGSDVISPQGSIDITAQKVDITEARETSRTVQETKFKQSGLTVAVTSPVISAIQTAQQMSQAASQTSDGRMQALAAATTALSAKNAYDAIAADPQAGGGVGISITVGSSQSQSTSAQVSDTAAGSTVTAGQNVRITATGAGKDSDITLQGTQASAAGNIVLSAQDEIRLLAARNDSDLKRDSKSSSAGVGVAITYGSNGFAAGITANASASKGNADGHDVTWTNTRVEAGNTLVLQSGGDTTLKGAVAAGKQVIADIGGDLSIESLQDTSTYHSQQKSIGGSVTVGYGFAASANIGRQKMDSDFASVTEQSGIRAGDDGFQIDVQGNTDLKGATIASTELAAAAGRNWLETGTLTVSDIENRASYKASGISLGAGYSSGGGAVGTDQQGKAQTGAQTPGTTLPSLDGFSATLPVAMNASDDASSITRSGISGATLVITDDNQQKALTGKDAATTIASLNTSVSSSKDGSNALKPIFNEQEIQAGFTIVSALSNEIGTFLANRAKEADIKKARADKLEQTARSPEAGLSDEQRLQMIDEARALRTEAQSIGDNWGAGGTYRQIATALVAAASGNVSAASNEFARDMLVNYVQQQGAGYIGKLVADGTLTEGSPLHAALHGIVACAGAAASSQSCAAGATGAAASSLLTGLFGESNPNETNAEREAKRNLIVSIVTGIGASGDAATATNAVGAAVDNNWLATQQIVQMKKELVAATNLLEQAKVVAKWGYISGKQDVLTTTGIGKGLAESGWSDVKGLAEFLSDPIKGLQGLKEVITNPEVRQKLGDSIFAELDAKIGRMQTAMEHGGDQNAEQLGKDLGALIWQVGSVATGAAGVAKGGVMLAKLGVSAGTNLLETAAVQFMKLDAGAIKGFKSADEINAAMLEANKSLPKDQAWAPAWKSGTAVAETTIKPGTRVRMVVSEDAWNEIGRGKFDEAFGGWATFDDVPSQAYARNQLAMTPSMKADVGYVIEIEITQAINAKIGVVGAQGAARGGGNQLHFVIPRDERASVFKVVGGKALP